LKSTGLAIGSGLWETVGMGKLSVGDLVRSHELDGVFQVMGIQVGSSEKCFIQEFDVSKHRLTDATQVLVSCSTLSPFKEDASQAAARIVREATERQ
jgi:hypothetical protein